MKRLTKITSVVMAFLMIISVNAFAGVGKEVDSKSIVKASFANITGNLPDSWKVKLGTNATVNLGNEETPSENGVAQSGQSTFWLYNDIEFDTQKTEYTFSFDISKPKKGSTAIIFGASTTKDILDTKNYKIYDDADTNNAFVPSKTGYTLQVRGDDSNTFYLFKDGEKIWGPSNFKNGDVKKPDSTVNTYSWTSFKSISGAISVKSSKISAALIIYSNSGGKYTLDFEVADNSPITKGYVGILDWLTEDAYIKSVSIDSLQSVKNYNEYDITKRFTASDTVDGLKDIGMSIIKAHDDAIIGFDESGIKLCDGSGSTAEERKGSSIMLSDYTFSGDYIFTYSLDYGLNIAEAYINYNDAANCYRIVYGKDTSTSSKVELFKGTTSLKSVMFDDIPNFTRTNEPVVIKVTNVENGVKIDAVIYKYATNEDNQVTLVKKEFSYTDTSDPITSGTVGVKAVATGTTHLKFLKVTNSAPKFYNGETKLENYVKNADYSISAPEMIIKGSGYTVFCALYSNNQLIDVKSFPIDEFEDGVKKEAFTSDKTNSADTAKIFVWDNLYPVSMAYVID